MASTWPPATHQDVTDAITGMRPPKSKTFALPIGGDLSYTSTSFTDLLFRPGILLPVTSTQWRIRVKNHSINSGAIAGALTMTAVYLGTPTFVNGMYRGAASNLVQVLAAPTLPSDGSEYVGAWVTDPTMQFTADVPAVLSYGITCGGGQTLARGDNMGVCFYSVGSSAQVAAASPTGSSTVQAAFLDVILDIVTTTNYPILLGVGDSLLSRQVDDANLTPAFPGPCSSSMAIAGLRERFLWLNAGVAGNQTGNFMSASDYRYSRFKFGPNGTNTTPDAAFINTGVNDAAVSSVAVATFITNHQTIVNTVMRTGLGIPRVYAATVMPQPNFKGGLLMASAAAAATSIQTQVAYASGDSVEIGYGTTRAETKTVSGASTGTVAPFTTPIAALTNAHPAGEAIGLASTESLRRGYNDTYLRRSPAGCQGVWDFDFQVRDPWNPFTFEQALLGTGTVHMGQGGQERVARLISMKA